MRMNQKGNFPTKYRYFETDKGILYCGNALDILPEIREKPTLILTDLPYGTTHLNWDKPLPMNKMWDVIKKIRKDNTAILLFGIEPFASYLRLSNIKEYKYDLYWKKERITNVLQVKKRFGKVIENICVFYKKQPKYFPQKQEYHGKLRKNKRKDGTLGALIDNQCKEIVPYKDDRTRYPTQLLVFNRDNTSKGKNYHPTQKPVSLLEFLIRSYTEEGDLVIDFTSGSGSTLVAAENLNRRWIGIEINPEYCEITKKRMTNEEN